MFLINESVLNLKDQHITTLGFLQLSASSTHLL